jgi:anti-sigma factor RsiW
VSKLTDPDLMMLADGELDAADAGAMERSAGAAGAAKIAGIREVGELVRGHLELAADEADDRLAGLWDLVERRIDAGDEREVPAAAVPEKPGAWSRFLRWMDSHRGHMLTGALSAGAVAAIAFMLRGEPEVKVLKVEVPVAGTQVGTGPATGPTAGSGPTPAAVLVATPPEVESLEVEGGTGTVFTITDDEGGSDTAVIWITPDDVLEGI